MTAAAPALPLHAAGKYVAAAYVGADGACHTILPVAASTAWREVRRVGPFSSDVSGHAGSNGA